MFEDLLSTARMIDVSANTRNIEQKMAAEEYSRLERLEAALVQARAHIHWPMTTNAARGR